MRFDKEDSKRRVSERLGRAHGFVYDLRSHCYLILYGEREAAFTHTGGDLLHGKMFSNNKNPEGDDMAARDTTTAQRFTVVQTEHLDEGCARWLAERVDLVVCSDGEAEFAEALARADGLVVRTYTRVDEGLLAKAPRLKVVGRAGVGVDNIDVAACRARGVIVVNTPDANTQAVVEYVLGILTDALRPRHWMSEAVGEAEWKRLRATFVGRRQLDEMVLGVYGMGRIGRRVAKAATAIGMRVLYCDLVEIPEAERHGAQPVDRESLLREADVLTLHVDGRPENRHMIDDPALAMVKPDVVFINTARGMLVNGVALAGFLRKHSEAQAWVDVHEPEPFGADYPLVGLANAHLAPHLASRTETAMRRMSAVVYDVWRVLNGIEPEWPVG